MLLTRRRVIAGMAGGVFIPAAPGLIRNAVANLAQVGVSGGGGGGGAGTAFNNAADLGDNGGATNSLTKAYNVGLGANRLLVVGILGDNLTGGADDITGVTYNAIAMTLAAKFTTNLADSGRMSYAYYLLGPTSGNNNVVINCTANHYLLAVAADYANVKQTTQPDATATNNAAFAADTSLTTPITTTTDKAWTVLVLQGYQGNAAPLAGAGDVRRAYNLTFGNIGIFDSGADVTPAGAFNMTTTYGASPTVHTTHIITSFKPV